MEHILVIEDDKKSVLYKWYIDAKSILGEGSSFEIKF